MVGEPDSVVRPTHPPTPIHPYPPTHRTSSHLPISTHPPTHPPTQGFRGVFLEGEEEEVREAMHTRQARKGLELFDIGAAWEEKR